MFFVFQDDIWLVVEFREVILDCDLDIVIDLYEVVEMVSVYFGLVCVVVNLYWCYWIIIVQLVVVIEEWFFDGSG